MSRFKILRQSLIDISRTPAEPISRPSPTSWSNADVTGSCLGHSTVLLNVRGLVVLTDPVLFNRVGLGTGPFIIGPKRYVRCALRPKQIPTPDVLLLSHAHMDHLDFRSLRRFPRTTPIITAAGTADLLQCLGFKNVRELKWGEQEAVTTPKGSITFEAFQVAHWGARMLKDDHRSYNAYVIEREDVSICFAGDTAYTHAFSALARRQRPLDLMLMPIGAYNPWIRAHCDPEQAAAMTRQSGASHVVPIHHQTFKLSAEPMDEPARRFRVAFAEEPERLLASHVGETFVLPRSKRVSAHSDAAENASPLTGTFRRRD